MPQEATPSSTSGTQRLRVGLATMPQGWDEDDDAPALVDALERAGAWAGPASWHDTGIDWSSFDLVVVRSTWDYAQRATEFVAWARRVGAATTLLNPPEVLAWNIDKHHLTTLAARGCPVVSTTFVEPGDDPTPAIGELPHGELVVKPAISAGSKDTLRHDADRRDDAIAHARAITSGGRAAMVQPYLSSVDRLGETGMVYLDGELSHAFRKGPLLSPGGRPVEGLFAREQIEPRTPAGDEVALAEQVLDAACAELGVDRLAYARVDVLRDGDRPVLLELELTEPSFFLETDPGAADRAARCFAAHAGRARAAKRGR